MLKIVLDSNVIISAIIFGGKPLEVLLLVVRGKFKAYISKEIEFEVIDKITNKFGEDLKFTLEILDAISVLRDVKIDGYIGSTRDPKDDFILAVADKINADYIISGDKDLLVLGNHRKCQVISPREFLDNVKI